MNCHICSGPLGDPKIDPKTNKIKHCHTCEEVIMETLAEMESDDDIDNPDDMFWADLGEDDFDLDDEDLLLDEEFDDL